MGFVKPLNPSVSGVLGHIVRLEEDVVVEAGIFDMGLLWESEQMPH